jgi:PadR family transcriptional regulator, regulatory protein PadR
MDTYFISKWKSQIKKGLLEYIIMLILKSKSCYGYELIADINRVASMGIAEGTIYPLLNRLKKEKLVISEWIEMDVGIPRKYYKLTEEGIAQLAIMQEYIESLNISITELIKLSEK